MLFADLVGFTGQAALAAPADLVAALDEMFSRFGELADRFGLEKSRPSGTPTSRLPASLARAPITSRRQLRWPWRPASASLGFGGQAVS